MLQSPEILGLPAELRGALSPLMVGATFTEEVLREDCLPLLLMQRDHSVTAFAVGDEADYESLYEAFKKHYLKRSAEWSTKDVSFVFCLPAQIPVQESFRSRVEVDVYFCRKYVLHLGSDLAGSLSRLPFLPLSPVAAGAPARPPSAQTLLRQRSLKADLAKALVVPAKSSATSILNACLEGAYGAPEKLVAASVEAPTEFVADERAQATLKSISIENFRAYRTKKEFTLGSAITVLYGPNGFGKTSFFDAVDFVVTGGVGRLSTASAGLAKAAKHLESEGDPTLVSLTIEREGVEHVITRDLADHNNAQVNGKTTSRKDVLSLLTGGAPDATSRVDNMVALFRATHLFSQENQELTRDVAGKCELPAGIVSRMLAFEDYVSGLKKAEDVLKLARLSLSEAETQTQRARSAIDIERVELKRLEGLASAVTSSDVIDARFAALERAILDSGFKVSGISVRDTRALRAMLESSATEAVSLRLRVTKAIEHVTALKTLREQLEPMLAQLDERRNAVEKNAASANEASERLGVLTSELAQLKTQEGNLQNQLEWLEWANSVQPEYAQLIAQSQVHAENLSQVNQLLNQQREKLSVALSAKTEASAGIQRHDAVLKAARDVVALVKQIKEEAGRWAQVEPRFAATDALVAKLQVLPEEKRVRLTEMQQGITAQQHLITQAERELASARANDSNLQKLIAELRTHINSATCLLCGHDHGSQVALLAAIDQRIAQSDRVFLLSEAVGAERAKLQAQLTMQQGLSDELVQQNQQLAQAKSDRDDLEQQRLGLAAALASIGLALSDDLAKQLTHTGSQADEAVSTAAREVQNVSLLAATADINYAAALEAYQALERQRQAATDSQEGAKSRLNELLTDASRGAIDLAADLPSLAASLGEIGARLLRAGLAVKTASTALDSQKAFHAAAKASLTAARVSHQEAAQVWNTYNTNIESLVAALTAAQVDSDASTDLLHQRIQEASAREATAKNLRDRVADVEIAVDTAATSAAFQSMRGRISVNERLIEEACINAEKVAPWVTYFEEVTKLLGSQQAVATDHFIKQYGPRTAVIQQRLRPVYGFGEIEVSSKESAIDIRVHRKGQELRPTDYFSQSQIQTLVLGLFLTACSSQTWSGFSSIMMDDPVSHFDDLNTYALLDLILGLQSSPEGERQFVISTCDEKLLQLARQKFKHMGAAAKFYRFSAIGAEGPMVSQIPS